MVKLDGFIDGNGNHGCCFNNRTWGDPNFFLVFIIKTIIHILNSKGKGRVTCEWEHVYKGCEFTEHNATPQQSDPEAQSVFVQ